METSIKSFKDILTMEENLKEIQNQLEEAKKLRIKSLSKRSPEILQLVADIKNIAESYFVTEQLVMEMISIPSATPKRTRRKTYQSPNDKNLTWNGIGKKPLWVEQLLAEGFALSDLQI